MCLLELSGDFQHGAMTIVSDAWFMTVLISDRAPVAVYVAKTDSWISGTPPEMYPIVIDPVFLFTAVTGLPFVPWSIDGDTDLDLRVSGAAESFDALCEAVVTGEGGGGWAAHLFAAKIESSPSPRG